MAEYIPAIQQAMLTMQDNEKGKSVLESMDVSHWEPMDSEQTEFMIDLIDTLIDWKHAPKGGVFLSEIVKDSFPWFPS